VRGPSGEKSTRARAGTDRPLHADARARNNRSTACSSLTEPYEFARGTSP